MRLAIVVSHPIQHFCPQYVSFAKHPGVKLKVFFASSLGLKKYVDPNFGEEISWGNLQLDQFDHVFLNGDLVLLPDKNLDATNLEDALESFSPDIVIIYGYFQQLQRRTHRWAKKHKVRIAYISDSERRQHRSKIKELIKYPFIHWYFSSIDFFLSVGDANEEFYRYNGAKNNQLIRMHFPIDVSVYEKSFQERKLLGDKIRRQYEISQDEIVTAVVGKLVAWKNQDDIIEAMRLLENQGIYLHLLMIGSGDMMEAWKEKAATLRFSKVHFTGFINIEDLPGYYAAADFYIHPASIEPHSIAVSEAIYMGCPVLISDRCGSYGKNDDVQEEKNGMVYPFGNISALAEAMRRMYSEKALRMKMSAYSHEISKQFQEKSHTKVLQELIKKIS